MEFKFSKVKVVFQLIVATILVVAGIATLVMAENKDEPVPHEPTPTTTAAPVVTTAAPVVTTAAPVTTTAAVVDTQAPDTTAGGDVTTAPDVTTAATESTTAAVTTAPFVNPYTRTLTLGRFNARDATANQGGWETNGVNGRSSTYTVAQFTGAKYLVVEFTEIPEGVHNFGFAWRSLVDEMWWNQTQTRANTIENNMWVIDLTKMNGAANFKSSLTALEVFIWVDDLPWGTLKMKEAYLAN